MILQATNKLELLIKDCNKKIKPEWWPKENKYLMDCLTPRGASVFLEISNSNPGTVQYYGISYLLYGCTDNAFYKSLDNTIYYIESINGVPMYYYPIS